MSDYDEGGVADAAASKAVWAVAGEREELGWGIKE